MTAPGGRFRIRFEPPDLVERLRRGGAIMEKALDDALEDLARRVEAGAKKAAPKHTGHLQRSIGVRKPRKLAREVGSGLEYAPFVEFGTRPHWPPYAPIRDWVWLNRGKFGVSSKRDVNRIAVFVQRKIARSGTRPKPYFKPAWDAMVSDAKTVITQYAREALGRMGSGSP